MIIALSIILALLLLLTCKEQGLKIIKTICFNLLFIIICIFLIANGVPVWIAAFVMGIGFLAFTLLYQFGLNQKTVLSFFSCLIVLFLMYFMIHWFVKDVKMAGLNDLDLNMDVSQAIDINIKISMEQLAIAVVMLGALGAIMDAAIAVSSCVFEIYMSDSSLSFPEILKSAGKIGYDILGTTINTLLLAGLGDFYLYCVFFAFNHFSIGDILNSETVFQSFASVMIGSIACLFILPLTTCMMAGYLSLRKKELVS